jgi:hypothetical protein
MAKSNQYDQDIELAQTTGHDTIFWSTSDRPVRHELRDTEKIDGLTGGNDKQRNKGEH